MGINCIWFIMGPVHTRNNGLMHLGLAPRTGCQAATVTGKDHNRGASSPHPVSCGLRKIQNSSCNIEALWSHTYWCHQFPPSQVCVALVIITSSLYSSQCMFMIYLLQGSTWIQYQEYSNQEMWDSKGGPRWSKRWPSSLGHVMWHFVPHIRYEILEVAPVLFHVALSFRYQSSNKSCWPKGLSL